MKIKHIRTKLISFIILLIVVLTTINNWYFLSSYSKLLYDELKKRGIEIANNLAYTSREGILTGNLFSELTPLVESVKIEPDVAFVTIVNKTGLVLAHSNPKEIGKVYEDELTKKALLFKNLIEIQKNKQIIIFGSKVRVIGEGILEKTQELEGKKPETIGAVIIGVSLKNLHLKMNHIFTINLIITVGMAILGVIFTFLFSTSITKPIRSLTEVAHAISQGEIWRRANVKTADEVGELANSFNQMTTDLINSREEVQKAKEHLEERVEEATKEIKKTNLDLTTRSKELEKVNLELDRFTYTVSHDLKEPLRSIETFTNFLLEDYSDKLDDEAKDFLKRISASANRMKNMIGDLLTLSRFSKMESSFESIVPETIIKSALKRIEPIISEKNVQIKIADDLPIIYGDKVKLVEVFYNLISNAIKYNNREKPIIEIDQPMPQPAKDEVVIYVKDNGIGIEEQYYEEIFKIFKRLHTREEYGGGTGVGLPIVRKIMDDHNGRVWLESKVEQGTTFYLAFPKKVIGNL